MAIRIDIGGRSSITSRNSSPSYGSIRWFSGEKKLKRAVARVHVTFHGIKLPLEIEPSVGSIRVKSFEQDWNLHAANFEEGKNISCFVLVRNGRFGQAAKITVKVNPKAKKQTVLWRATFNTRMKVLEGNFDVVSIKTSARYNFLSVQNIREMRDISDYMANYYCTKDVLEVEPFIPNDEVWEPFEVYRGKYKGNKKFGVHLTKVKQAEGVTVKTYEPTRLLDV